MAEFIDITEPRSPLGTENILRPYKRGEAEITVDVCTGVLRGTNFARSIRDMLGCVEKIPQEKMPEFREIILSVFCGREQPDDILELGAKIAAAAGYASELTALPKDIEVPAGESGGRMCLMSAPVKRRRLDLTVSEGDYHFNNVDFGAYDRLCVYPRPDSYGTGWKTVTFDGCKNFPKETDFSRVRYILLDHCRLESVSGYKFSRDCEVRFGGFAPVDGLPADRDFRGLKKFILIAAVMRKEMPSPCFRQEFAPILRDLKIFLWKPWRRRMKRILREWTFRDAGNCRLKKGQRWQSAAVQIWEQE